MAKFVIGMGHQPSVRNIIRIAEKQLASIEGQPGKIVTDSDYLEITARREDLKGAFGSFTFCLKPNGLPLHDLRAAAAEHPEVCQLREEEGGLVIDCQPNGEAGAEAVRQAVEALSGAITLPEVWRVEGGEYQVDPVSVELLFQAMVQYRASDVHLSPGTTPIFRIDNETHHSELIEALSAHQIRSLIRDIAPDPAWTEYEEHKQTSFNFHQVGLGYARVSAFTKNGAPHCTFRFLPEKIPSFEELNVPRDTMERLADLHRGLVLVTGMTGSGKTTTVAAIIDWINSRRALHILTIENPIEYVHTNKKSIVSQRSLGTDVESFHDAVTGALRHDPDVILIGEMRDPDTIRSAINAAATGHLVISTLHSNTASEVVNRIVSFFDPIERDLVKLQLRDCMQCVVCQRLVPKIGGGRVPSLEILLNDVKAIGDGISDGHTDLIRVGMQQTVSHSFLFEQYLHGLYKAGTVELEQARSFATDVSIFDQLRMGTYSVPRLDSIKNQGDHTMFKA